MLSIANERSCAVIDLDAMSHNINLVRRKVGANTKILLLIKADAYGHGAVAIAKNLCIEVDYFGVATFDEAMQLKRANITNPIMIMGHVMPSDYVEAVKNGVILTISSLLQANDINDVAQQCNKVATVHFAVDTGMSRIGFLATDINQLTDAISAAALPHLYIEGIFTHFACADCEDKTHARAQLQSYKDFISQLSKNGIDIPIKHVCNSAGIMEFDDCFFNMVRYGIAAYGLYPSTEVGRSFNLQPVMSWYTHISHIKEVNEGTGVSYGATRVTSRRTRIATLPVGYADGYPRALSNIGYVAINGQRANILGRICMDQMMVDVSDIIDVAVGDLVTLVGVDNDTIISVEDLANNASSFNYEFVCGVGVRVPRLYRRHGQLISRNLYIMHS